jgi:hypothetical protein
MRFDQREWISEMATGTIVGGLTGAIGAVLVPDPPYVSAISVAAILGFVAGAVNLPIKWLLDLRPQPKSPHEEAKE